MLEAVIAEGATTINIPDTVGYAVPELYGEFLLDLRQKIPNSDKAVWSVHCHNDLGMAVANSLAGGEDRRRAPGRVHHQRPRRARGQLLARGDRDGGEDPQGLLQASSSASMRPRSSRRRAWSRRPPASSSSRTRRWSAPTRSPTPRASTRTACSKARDTYEIMRAEDVGWAANKIVLGKLSGRNAFKQRLKELGIEMEAEADINAAFVRFKELADRKSDIFDEDILALVMDEAVVSRARALPAASR